MTIFVIAFGVFLAAVAAGIIFVALVNPPRSPVPKGVPFFNISAARFIPPMLLGGALMVGAALAIVGYYRLEVAWPWYILFILLWAALCVSVLLLSEKHGIKAIVAFGIGFMLLFIKMCGGYVRDVIGVHYDSVRSDCTVALKSPFYWEMRLGPGGTGQPCAGLRYPHDPELFVRISSRHDFIIDNMDLSTFSNSQYGRCCTNRGG